MSYEMRSRVRYSETDCEGKLSVTALFNYLQDCSTFHSNDVGLSTRVLEEENRAWLLSFWDVYIVRMPELYESIRIGTSPHFCHGVIAYRNFWIQDEEGSFLVKADSVWFLYDTGKRKPTRITEKDLTPFGERKDVLGLPRGERRIHLRELREPSPEIRILPHYIDGNRHVNNAQYVQMAADVLRERGICSMGMNGIRRIRAEYQKAAVLSDILVPHVGVSEEGDVVSFRSREGEVYCNVEIG